MRHGVSVMVQSGSRPISIKNELLNYIVFSNLGQGNFMPDVQSSSDGVF